MTPEQKEGPFQRVDNSCLELIKLGWTSILGWPKWPPKEVPPSTEWFRNEVCLLPTRPLRKGLCTVTIDGTPHAGKTALENKLQQYYSVPDSPMGFYSINPDEIYAKRDQELFFLANSVFAPYLSNIDREDLSLYTMGELSDGFSWYNQLFLQLLKSKYWDRIIRREIPFYGDQKKYLVLGQRGPIDQTVFCHALAAHIQDPDYAIPEQFRHTFQEYYQLFLIQALLDVAYMDAVVIIGTSQGVAQERRQKMGRSKGVAFSPFFQDLSAWYGYCVEKVLPQLHKKYGVGVLVLDGTKPIDENYEILDHYTRSVQDRCFM